MSGKKRRRVCEDLYNAFFFISYARLVMLGNSVINDKIAKKNDFLNLSKAENFKLYILLNNLNIN